MMKKLLTLILVLTSLTTLADSLAVAPNNNEKIQVVAAYELGNSKINQIELFDILVVRVKGFQTLLNKINAQGGTTQSVKLFLDGRQIDALPTIVGEPTNNVGEFQFTLERNKDNNAAWTDLLGSPSASTFFHRPMDVSVGVDKSYAEQSIVKIDFIRIEKRWFYGCVTAVLLYLFILVYYGKRYNLLRNPNVDLSILNIDQPVNTLTPYSLGKVQMAFWFSIVLISFIFIWLITDNYDLITPGILGLIGISGSTALGAVVIDTGKNDQAIKQIQELQQQQNTIAATLSNLKALDPPAAATAGDILFNENLYKQVSKNIDHQLKSLQLKTQGLMNDILTDVNGYSFHRLQMFTWTLVLGLVFIYSVWSELTMPDFSTTMLAVQGITAGTYLGFKFPEKQA